MFELIKSNTNFDFVGKFKIAMIVSGIIVTASIVGLFTKMQYGVDFRGGAEIQVKFTQAVDLGQVRSAVEQGGFNGATVLTIGEASENEVLVRVGGDDSKINEISQNVSSHLTKTFASQGVEIRKVDIVGPKAGAQLRTSGFQAMAWALLVIMVYIGLRFDFKYAPGAIAATFHDVALVLGVYALTGTEFTLQTVAALLAVIGYSVNDTVIVYDRVREYEAKFPGGHLPDLINRAMNETLSRTILTSGTTLFVSLSMLFFGGEAIKDFFLAMSVGIIVGTYSSLYIAAPVTLFFEKVLKKGESSAKGAVSAK
jgi:preprotein translocase subunit SecF